MTVQFDNKISLGHIISIVTVLAACIMGYATLSARQERLSADVLAMQRAVYDPQPVVAEDGSVTVAPERFGVMA